VAGTTRLIDRQPQNLPVPLGGMTPLRVTRSRFRRRPRVAPSTVCVAVGLASAAAGTALLLAPAPVAVSLQGERLQVGGMTLTAVGSPRASGPVLFFGGASYVLIEHNDRTATAAAVWTSGGVTSSGVCHLHPQGDRLIDECSVTSSSGAALTAVDLLDPARGSAWQRTYSDGSRVTIAVPPDGAAVPVPFPIGR
jgi:hypothetical protein